MRLVLVMVVAVASTAAPLRAQAPPPAKPAQPAAAPGGQQPKPAQPQPVPPPGASPKPASPQAAPATPTPAPAAPTPNAAPPTAAPAPQTGAPSAAAPAVQPEPYSYSADGRRDPFTSLIGTGGSEVRSSGRQGDGPGGMAVADVSVRGILQSRGSLVAMIQGPDNKTYIVHQGDKLLDGVIKTITPQGLIVTQEVNDPLSLVKQREVSKLLRSLEVVKP